MKPKRQPSAQGPEPKKEPRNIYVSVGARRNWCLGVHDTFEEADKFIKEHMDSFSGGIDSAVYLFLVEFEEAEEQWGSPAYLGAIRYKSKAKRVSEDYLKGVGK